jgi:hypothetical protein
MLLKIKTNPTAVAILPVINFSGAALVKYTPVFTGYLQPVVPRHIILHEAEQVILLCHYPVNLVSKFSTQVRFDLVFVVPQKPPQSCPNRAGNPNRQAYYFRGNSHYSHIQLINDQGARSPQ